MDKIFKAPKIVALNKIQNVGFYDYLAMRECVLKSLNSEISLSTSRQPELPSKATMVGRFHHKVFEYACTAKSRSSLRAKIEDQIQNLQKEVDGWSHLKRYGTVSGWDEINASAISAVNFFKFHQSDFFVDGSRFIEKLLISNEMLLKGKPDYFSIKSSNAFVREYKSSSLRDENGNLREEYRLQGLFYAVLIYDNFNVENIEISLESIHSDRFVFSVSKIESEKFRQSVITEVGKANDLISQNANNIKLENPSSVACQYCKNKIVCTSFDKMQFQMALKGSAYKLNGKVTSAKHLNHGAVVIQIKSQTSERIFELNIPSTFFKSIEIGKEYLLENLNFNGTTLGWTDLSRMYSYD